MVSTSRRLILTAGVAVQLALSLPADEPFPYRIGDTITADIVASTPFQVVNSQNAAALPQEAAQKVPVIYRHDTSVADGVEKDLRAAFGTMRTNFFTAMGAVYQKRKLNQQWLTSPRFQTLSSTFRQQHRGFPQLTNLVELWAVGKSDADVQALYAVQLKEAMKPFIRADDPPADLPSGPQIWLVTNVSSSATTEAIAKAAATVDLTNLMPLARARAEFEAKVAVDDAVAAKFLGAFLKPNCLAEAELTRRLRAQFVVERLAVDNYAAGQIIARRGQKADAKIVAALEQMRTLQHAAPRVENAPPVRVSWLYRLNPWYWAIIALGAAGLVFSAWRMLNRNRAVSNVPARVGGDGAFNVPNTPQAHEAVRAGVMPHLADWLKQKLVRGLFADRQQLLEAQKSAALELAELERRLDELHAPLQERLRAYEKRIVELEQMLTVKGEENRELLRAKIQMTRQQLQNARARNRLEFN